MPRSVIYELGPYEYHPQLGESAAAIYTLLGTAKVNGIDPEGYLRDVLSRIADRPIKGIEELLLWNVAASLSPEIDEAV